MRIFEFLSNLVSLIIFLFKEFFPLLISFLFQLSILIIGGIFFYGGVYASRTKQSIFEDVSYWYVVDGVAVALWLIMITGIIKTIESLLDNEVPDESVMINSFLIGVPILIGALILSHLGLGVYMYQVNTYLGMVMCLEYLWIMFIKPSL